MPGQLNGAVGAVFLAYCGWWLTSTPERGKEKHLVRILEKQLDRCGPDHLTTPAPILVHECSLWSAFQVCCFGILLGIILTCWTGGCIYYRLRQALPSEYGAESLEDEAVHEPSIYTHGTSALAGPRRVNKLLALEYSELEKLGY